MNFLKHRSASCKAVNAEYRKLSDFIKKIFICVPKMNERNMGLERHDGD